MHSNSSSMPYVFNLELPKILKQWSKLRDKDWGQIHCSMYTPFQMCGNCILIKIFIYLQFYKIYQTNMSWNETTLSYSVEIPKYDNYSWYITKRNHFQKQHLWENIIKKKYLFLWYADIINVCWVSCGHNVWYDLLSIPLW